MSSFADEKAEDNELMIINDINSKKRVYFGVLVMLGLLNNLGYVLINSSAQQLGIQFGQEKLMSLFTFCLTMLGVVTSFFNSKYLLKVRHFSKIQITLTCYTVAYLCVGASNLMRSFSGFALCLFGSIVMGVSSTLGEQTSIGFLKGFAPDLISGWACGTGFAGVFGAGINVILRFMEIPGYLIFLGMIPTNLLYLFGFMWLKEQKVHQIETTENNADNMITPGSTVYSENIEDNKDQLEADINQSLSMKNLKRVWPMIWTLAINLGAVYFLEYGIITGFADVATDEFKDSLVPVKRYGFILLNLCYQIGVVISRSSLVCIKIRKVWIITALQFMNYFTWAIIAYTKEVTMEIMLVLMIWVGLMGGASYVNILYLILESNQLEKKDKEVSINITSMCNNTGVLLTTLLSLFLENTVYKDK